MFCLYLKEKGRGFQTDRFHGGEGHGSLMDEGVHNEAQERLAYDEVLVLIFSHCDDLLLSYVIHTDSLRSFIL